ncbi:MAG: hypothetical protein HDQ88_11830 [Clostridia bacterium]|nr:hypothetical protein [Clostridia bacterium]
MTVKLNASKASNNKEPKIERMMTLSPLHLAPNTYKGLVKYKPKFKTIAVAVTSIGMFVTIGDFCDHEFADDLSEDLFDVVMFARSRNCSVVRFGQGTDVIPHLNYYYETETRYEGDDI